jgi:GT2 family glycosyltransferase
VVIPSWNGRQWLKGCLDALRAQDFRDFEVLLVDDASTDGSAGYVKAHFPEVNIVQKTRREGFAKTANAGVKASSGEYVVLLNTDTRPTRSWLGELVRTMDGSPPEVGSLASCMVQMDNPHLIDSAGDILTWYGQALKRGNRKPVSGCDCTGGILSACAGAALYRREFLQETGGFDGEFGSYLEDIDLGLRGRLSGYTCTYVPSATVLHKGHGSGIPHRDYIRLVTRNRLMLFWKNIPLRLLVRHLHHLLAGQLALFVQYRSPFDSIAGYLSVVPRIPHIVRERRRILAARTLSDSEIDALLEMSREGISLPGWSNRADRGEHP